MAANAAFAGFALASTAMGLVSEAHKLEMNHKIAEEQLKVGKANGLVKAQEKLEY